MWGMARLGLKSPALANLSAGGAGRAARGFRAVAPSPWPGGAEGAGGSSAPWDGGARSPVAFLVALGFSSDIEVNRWSPISRPVSSSS